MRRRRTWSSSIRSAGSQRRWPTCRAASRSPATTSTRGRSTDRSTSAFAWSTRRRPSSCTGRPTWVRSAASTTSRSGLPDLQRELGPVGDDCRDPRIGDETVERRLLVHRPDPRGQALAPAVTKDVEVSQLPVHRDEVGVASLEAVMWKRLAEPCSQFHPGRRPSQLVAEREAGGDFRKLLLDRAYDLVA